MTVWRTVLGLLLIGAMSVSLARCAAFVSEIRAEVGDAATR